MSATRRGIGQILGTPLRRVLACVLVAAVALAVIAAAWPRGTEAPIIEHDETISVPGGPGIGGSIDLDAGLYLPTVTPAPAVIVAHGFGGTRHSVDGDARRLARAGFVVLTYSARGFGASGGQIALDSLDYEVPDARHLVDWLSRRPEVLQDGPDDPRVGVTGGSYGGALALMLAGTDPRVDAVAAVATWNNLQQALFPNNGAQADAHGTNTTASTPAAIPARSDGVFKQQWAASLLTSVLAQGVSVGVGPAGGKSGMTPSCGRLMPDLCVAYTKVAETGRLTPEMASLLANSSPDKVAGKITAPTLLVQGEQDTLFGLDQADANARHIAANGTTVAMSWFAGGHSGGGLDHHTQDRITNWFRYYLADRGPKPSDAFWYAVHGAVSSDGRHHYRLLELPGYPGLNRPAAPTQSLALTGSPQTILNPPGGVPAAITSLPGLGALASTALAGASTLPGQTATYVSAPLARPLVIAGSPTIRLRVARAAGSSRSPEASESSEASGSSAEPGASSSPAGGSSAVLYASLAAVPSSQSSGGSAAARIRAALSGGPINGDVAPIRLDHLPTDGSPVDVTVRLPAIAYQVPAGDLIAVRIATTNQAFAGPKAPAVYRISLAPSANGHAAGAVQVPTAEGTQVPHSEHRPIGWAVALAALLVAIVITLLVVGNRRRRTSGPAGRAHHRRHPRLDQAIDPAQHGPAQHGSAQQGDDATPPPPTDIPLVITGLRKEYPGGVVAVDDATLTVERGQVLGMLGPNGAGKTTTLRMVMGLITPTAGEIRVFGERIEPGAPVLGRVGSFVEGAGFLPHLSGKKNLELYWKAAGRAPARSYIAEALQIAGLGTAVKRKVKTYSQGMRQRLAIAQAMLGLPDLLLLDEPTNGLDPPQIHAMREVMRRYAGTGRTVLVSSHLLSEVEQTCSHVVIMARGRTIAAGTVAEMVSAAGELLISTPTPEAARDALSRIDGVGEMDCISTGVVVDARSTAVNDLLRALLAADVTVTSVAPRNRLEEVFLDLVGAGGDGP